MKKEQVKVEVRMCRDHQYELDCFSGENTFFRSVVRGIPEQIRLRVFCKRCGKEAYNIYEFVDREEV